MSLLVAVCSSCVLRGSLASSLTSSRLLPLLLVTSAVAACGCLQQLCAARLSKCVLHRLTAIAKAFGCRSSAAV
jgi:hypothetical protein